MPITQDTKFRENDLVFLSFKYSKQLLQVVCAKLDKKDYIVNGFKTENKDTRLESKDLVQVSLPACSP